MFTKEEIEKRIDEIDRQMEQVKANYNALAGAKQENLVLLQKLAQADAAKLNGDQSNASEPPKS